MNVESSARSRKITGSLKAALGLVLLVPGIFGVVELTLTAIDPYRGQPVGKDPVLLLFLPLGFVCLRSAWRDLKRLPAQ